MEYKDWDASEEDINWTLEEADFNQYYWESVNAEHVGTPVIRTWDEWNRLEAPMTTDDLIDTMLFIKRIKER